MSLNSFTELPTNLPVPRDDGASNHLRGRALPDLTLTSTSGHLFNLSRQAGLFVLYAYPLTGRPGISLPKGWDEIPGARGCTPETCSFRDHHAEIQEQGADVIGLSTQSTDYQKEVHDRLCLPFDLLSDEDFAFTDSLSLPTFTVGSLRLLRRLTLIVEGGVIIHVFYPIFPPHEHPDEVISFLRTRNAMKAK